MLPTAVHDDVFGHEIEARSRVVVGLGMFRCPGRAARPVLDQRVGRAGRGAGRRAGCVAVPHGRQETPLRAVKASGRRGVTSTTAARSIAPSRPEHVRGR